MSNQQRDVEFVDGLTVKAPRDAAPDYIKAAGSIRRETLMQWLKAHTGEWINFDVKESKGGKWYCAVDTWKPKEIQSDLQETESAQPVPDNDFVDDEIPF